MVDPAHPDREAISAIGVNGQWIYVDRSRGVAVVKQSSQPVSADYAADQFTLNAFDAVIDHLASSQGPAACRVRRRSPLGTLGVGAAPSQPVNP